MMRENVAGFVYLPVVELAQWRSLFNAGLVRMCKRVLGKHFMDGFIPRAPAEILPAVSLSVLFTSPSRLDPPWIRYDRHASECEHDFYGSTKGCSPEELTWLAEIGMSNISNALEQHKI